MFDLSAPEMFYNGKIYLVSPETKHKIDVGGAILSTEDALKSCCCPQQRQRYQKGLAILRAKNPAPQTA